MSSQNNLRYITYTSEYHDDCLEILCDAFLRRGEPLGSHIPYGTGAFSFFCEYYLKAAEKDQSSTICVDVDADRAVGIMLSEDLCVEPDEELQDFLETLETRYGDMFPQIFVAVEQVEQPFLAHLEQTNSTIQGTVWHMWMVGVSADYARRGIGTKLVSENLKKAQERGYKYVVADCTNSYSTKCFEKHSFKLFNRLEYADYEFPPGSATYPLCEEFGNKDGFSGLDFMVLDLQNEEAISKPTTNHAKNSEGSSLRSSATQLHASLGKVRPNTSLFSGSVQGPQIVRY